MILNYEDKYDAEPLFSPKEVVAEQGDGLPEGPSAVVLLGGGAGLQPDLSPDAAILPTESIRDEGVSYHYIPPDEAVTPTESLVETLPEVEHYREQGVRTLDMETAAVWAVCQFHGVDTATVHELGDVLTPEEWVPETASERGLQEMLQPTVEALESHVGQKGS